MNRSARALRFAIWLALLGAFALPWSAGAQSGPDYARAMRDGFQNDVRRAAFPRYDLDLSVDPSTRRLNGTMKLSLRNTTGGALNDVVLRLYPAFPADVFGDGGDIAMRVSDIVVQGQPSDGRYEASGTALRVTLPEPVAAGGSIDLSLRYSANIVPLVARDGTFPLPSYYPMLAAWQDGWRTDVTRFPDRVYAESALYQARIRVPEGWTAIGSGSTIGTETRDGSRIFEMITGPIREFAFSVGRFATAHATHDGVEVAVHHRAGDGLDAAADTMAKHIAASIATFDGRFGKYPYRELEFHVMDARRGFDAGVEYPGLVLLLLNRRYTAETRYVTAHETAHQWFYGVVGNDIYNEPWLDEAFAQYGGTLVEEDWAGVAAFNQVYEREIARRAARARLPAGLSLRQYGTWNTYYASVYGRGAQFLHTLRREIGDDAFFGGLRAYVADHRYGVAHGADVQAALERSSGRNLDELFSNALGR